MRITRLGLSAAHGIRFISYSLHFSQSLAVPSSCLPNFPFFFKKIAPILQGHVKRLQCSEVDDVLFLFFSLVRAL